MLLKPNELSQVSYVKAEDKTEDDVLAMVRQRITDWAQASNYGEKSKKLGVANLCVTRRSKNGARGDYLAVKIANKTYGLVPFDKSANEKARKRQVQTVIDTLGNERAGLFAMYREVCTNLQRDEPQGKALTTL